MNKQTVYILVGIAAVAAVGYYLYQRNQRQQIVAPQAPTVGDGNNGGVVGQLQDAWDAIFGKS